MTAEEAKAAAKATADAILAKWAREGDPWALIHGNHSV